MTTYRAHAGHGIDLASLIVLSPQPRSMGVQATRREPMADGSIVAQGLYVELIWDVLEDATDVVTVLTPFGLHNATSANVTVYVRDDLYAWKRYSGRAIRPPASWSNYFPRGVIILVRDLVELA